MNKPGKFTAMISATAFDLPIHREKVQDACLGEEVFPLWMKHLPTRDENGVRVSMEMVDKADIYIGVYAWRYGWVPDFDNPDKISVTEMEFNRAVQRKVEGKLKEILIFVVHEDHPPARASDIEIGEEAQRKLKAFKDRASAGRVRGEFLSADDLQRKVAQALSAFLKNHGISEDVAPLSLQVNRNSIPNPPVFYAKPDYIGRHTFIGRGSQLQTLSDWAKSSDPTNVLLFTAIGGNGKSMLTWEWTNRHATKIRTDWAGRFWYSFYEKGAIMRDFCQYALAYMTGKPLETFEKRSAPDMRVELLALLHAQPWLLILDGLERVLVAYHRIDASEVPDEEVNRPTDKILDRHPCDAIRDEDTDLLRALAAASPSKILISSRLIPRVLLNHAGIPIPGVKPLELPGLDEDDAEALLRSCGIRGTSADIRYYLTNYCANHPLVIGVLAGLINSPGPHRGNFDAWAAAEDGGAKLNLASLELIPRRNHILRAALDALEPASRQLLSTLALLSDAVDYLTVSAFNPHLPTEPEEVENPMPPEQHWFWNRQTDEQKTKLRQQYQIALMERKTYEETIQTWRDSVAVREAPKNLAETMRDLEHRGLLQYDARTQRYDMHPVVRGVAAGSMKDEDKECYGQRVVDYFSSQPHDPYENAKTMEDVENGLHVVRTLLKLGHYQQAAYAYQVELANAISNNLEASVEALSLLKPLFSSDWSCVTPDLGANGAAHISYLAGRELAKCGEFSNAVAAYATTLWYDLEHADWSSLNDILCGIEFRVLRRNNLPATAARVSQLAADLAAVNASVEHIFLAHLGLLHNRSKLGRWALANEIWRSIDPMGRDWSRRRYKQGEAEYCFAEFQFWQGTLQEEHLQISAALAEQDNNRTTLRDLHRLRGAWRLEQDEWTLAAASFDQAVTMSRERRLADEESETGLAMAKFYLGQIAGDTARSEAERLAQHRRPAHRYLALLWVAIDDPEHAKHHALAAYKWAWADGEPYVNRYELTKTTELLQRMNVPIPQLPPYDPAKDEPFPWEADVRAAIEKLRAEKDKSKKLKKPRKKKRSD